MKLTTAVAAQRELKKATVYYRSVADDDTARKFVATVRMGFARLRETPHAWPLLASETPFRRYQLRKPFHRYSIIYKVTRRGVRVLAIAHARRRDKYWSKRR